MSADNPIDLDYTAKLARLALSDEEKQTFATQLGSVLDYFQRLEELDVSGVEPSAHPFPLENVLGADEPGPTLTAEQALQNAPAQRDGQIVVPKVVEDA